MIFQSVYLHWWYLKLTFSPYRFLNLKEPQQFYKSHELYLENFNSRRSKALVLGVLCFCIWPWHGHWAVFTAYNMCTCAYTKNLGILHMRESQNMSILHLCPILWRVVVSGWFFSRQLFWDLPTPFIESLCIATWFDICHLNLVKPALAFVLLILEFGLDHKTKW